MATHEKLIDLKKNLLPLARPLAPVLERLFSIDTVNDCYCRVTESTTGDNFFETGLKALGVDYTVDENDIDKIPSRGPLVAVANHPFGGVDGLVFGAVISQVRDDVMILGNELLRRMPGFRDRVVPVDVFGGRAAARKNLQGMKTAIRWVKGGGALITFPAGVVSHFHATTRSVVDSRWSPHVAAIMRHARATVLPVYFPGRNSWLFQAAGLLHPQFRTLLLPRELVNKHGRTVTVRIGKASTWKKLESAASDKERIHFLREKTYFLRNRDCQSRVCFPRFPMRTRRVKTEPVAPAVDPSALRREIRNLPESAMLAGSKELCVYVAGAVQIPQCLKEIGRIRELTFREAGEGTGKALDIDRFDSHYLHLFLWNDRAGEIAGAYRMGLTDEILLNQGVKGLYTSTLFRFREGFLHELGAAIELGRSFIRPEYQRKSSSLPLLWKGIAEFILRHPKYAKLFGPVSISQDYQRLSRDLIVMFLRQKKMDDNLSRLVSPRTPARLRRKKPIRRQALRHALYDTEEISLLVSEIEADGKGLPVLLKHYLKLEATLLSFNLDRAFSNVLDGLILLDLTRTESKTVKRFLGEDGYRVFRNYHQNAAPEPFYRKTG